MIVGLTGAAGHLGSLILGRCLAEPRISRIHALDLVEPVLRSPRIEYLAVDIRDADALSAALRECDVVIHTAFNVDRPARLQAMYETNVTGSRHVVAACLAGRARQLVYLSSGAVYGFGRRYPERFTEEDPMAPPGDFAYADQKCAVEEAVEEIVRAAETELTVTVLRPAICVGPRGKTAFARAMRRRRLVTTSRAPLQLLWDGDLAAAVLRALVSGTGGVFNLGADAPLTCQEMANQAGMRAVHVPQWLALAGVAGMNALGRLGLGGGADSAWIRYLPAAPWLDAALARRELGWTPQFPDGAAVIRHFAATVPRDRSPRFRRLVRLLAKHPPTPGSGAPGNIHISLLGPHGGDLTILFPERVPGLVPGRVPGAAGSRLVRGRVGPHDLSLSLPMGEVCRYLLADTRMSLPRPVEVAGEIDPSAYRVLVRWARDLRAVARQRGSRGARFRRLLRRF